MAEPFFQEDQREVLLIDFLIYVAGEEISSHAESLEVSFSGRGGMNTANIVLTNAFDQWIMTRANFRNVFRTTEGKYSEKVKQKIWNKKLQASKRTLNIQKDYGKVKFGGPATLISDADTDGSTETGAGSVAAEEFLQRYSFGPGSCIFSKMDPVRVFIRNPYSQGDNEWMPFFSGFVDTKPLEDEFVTGRSTLTLTCYDIRWAMQGMRVSLNPYTNAIMNGSPGTTDGSATTTATAANQTIVFRSSSAGFFQDIYPTGGKRSNTFDNALAGYSFVDAVSVITTGKTGWVQSLNTQTIDESHNFGGVGGFQPGQVYTYLNYNAEKTPRTEDKTKLLRTLEQWDLLCLFGEKKRWWTLAEVQETGRGSFTGDLFNTSNPHSPFNQKTHFLIPDGSLDISSMVIDGVDGANNLMGSPDWTDRMSLINNFCQTVDYEWTVTGNGDIVFEFPMYDFFPENFGKTSPVYGFDKHLKTNSISDEAGEVIAGLEAVSTSAKFADRQSQTELSNIPIQTGFTEYRAVAFSNVLASKYGARVQSVTLTGVNSTDALTRLVLIEFQKRMAEANKLSFQATYRPYLRPNRPVQIKEPNRGRIGKSTSVSYGFTMFAEPSMSVGMGCVRTPLFRGIDTAKSQKTLIVEYQHISGGAGMALSYNDIYETPFTYGNSDSGIAVNATKREFETPSTTQTGPKKSQ